MRHKRQALQDMARPLKQWLYKHRDNPYPTKTEKILLALGSQMTLVQVIRTPPKWVSPLAARCSCDCASSFLGWCLGVQRRVQVFAFCCYRG